MKRMRRAAFLLFLMLLMITTGCGSGNASSRTGVRGSGVRDILDSAEDTDGNPRENDIDQTKGTAEGVDVDLAALSGTVVYSEVCNMMMAPEDYIGRKVRHL